ncbi:hypothetical protein QN366_04755 [Pseudomonas sp. CCC3.2]|uniref:hypothetical protein n=1 Tax=unclassified Pseudomonas TaxID=196821 RepID=UPI002AB524FD|nr:MULTISPECIES: hypothetical protein [unclassified Pseudomonas]MDY7559977.1 hypothetical protein [Pseudomonas sp. AB6]MEB0179383.1 hypothetical protein [Pseudomonas sp. CCC3.2]MEB0210449.1 hypothetical protein [Pseudomonas sp. AB6]
MSIGDQSDMLGRLKSLLPVGWFGDNNPIRDATLWAYAQSASWAYTLYLYAQAQTRIKTASDSWLDLIALDFFGSNLARYSAQTDQSYLSRILINIFRERATRHGMDQVLFDLTGRRAVIIEPARPQDTGGLGLNFYLDGPGVLGSVVSPYQSFVTAYRPLGAGAANWPGVHTNVFGLGQTGGLTPAAQITPQVSDADIVAAIEATKPFGTTVWYRIAS